MSAALRFEQARAHPDEEPLHLEVEAGAFAVMIRPRSPAAGALRMATGQLRPAAGRVEVLGIEPARLRGRALSRFRHRLGVGFSPDGLVSNQTLRLNLLVPLLFAGTGHREARLATDQMLDACGLGQWATARPSGVPAEVRQCAAVARALVRRPELLLLHDPFAALDAETIQRLVDQCRRSAGTVLIATHREEPVLLGAADRVDFGSVTTTVAGESNGTGTN